MAVLFDWVGADGDGAFTSMGTNTEATYAPLGCDGGLAMVFRPNGIGDVQGSFSQELVPLTNLGGGCFGADPGSVYSDLSVRFQYGWRERLPGSYGPQPVLQLIYQANSGAMPTLYLYFTELGAPRIIMDIIAGGPVTYTGSNGDWAGWDDGMPHGIQLTTHFQDTSHIDIKLAVDNNVIMDFTHTKPTPPAGGYTGCSLPVMGWSHVGFSYFSGFVVDLPGEKHFMTRWDAITITDTYGIVDYPACSGATAIGEVSPGEGIIIDSAVWSADHTQVIVTGTGFSDIPEDATIDLQGPGAVSIPVDGFTATSDEELVIDVNPSYEFIAGSYCISISVIAECWEFNPE